MSCHVPCVFSTQCWWAQPSRIYRKLSDHEVKSRCILQMTNSLSNAISTCLFLSSNRIPTKDSSEMSSALNRRLSLSPFLRGEHLHELDQMPNAWRRTGTTSLSSVVPTIATESPCFSFTIALYSFKPHPLLLLQPPGIGEP